MALGSHLRAHRNHSLFQPRVNGARAGRQGDIPHLTVRADPHGSVRAADAERGFDGAGDLEFVLSVGAPSVMRGNGPRRERERDKHRGDAMGRRSASVLHINLLWSYVIGTLPPPTLYRVRASYGCSSISGQSCWGDAVRRNIRERTASYFAKPAQPRVFANGAICMQRLLSFTVCASVLAAGYLSLSVASAQAPSPQAPVGPPDAPGAAAPPAGRAQGPAPPPPLAPAAVER